MGSRIVAYLKSYKQIDVNQLKQNAGKDKLAISNESGIPKNTEDYIWLNNIQHILLQMSLNNTTNIKK